MDKTRRTISDLEEGEVAYTSALALTDASSVQAYGHFYINKTYPVYSEPTGDMGIKIQRQGSIILVEKNSIKYERAIVKYWVASVRLPVRLEEKIQAVSVLAH